MTIPISAVQVGEAEEKLVLEVLRSGRLAQGPTVVRFEEAISNVVGTRHAIAVNNGTSALIAALLANGIEAGDEVVTSPFTFAATLNAILFVGATPRFADIKDDYTVDPAAIEVLVRPSTKAILPVHLYGLMADMGTISAIARRHGLAVIEDAAQALGALSPAGAAGAFGTGCFSFYATKNITTGEGGMVTTNSDEVAQTLRYLRNQGQAGRYQYVMPGYNLRMTEMEAAIGVAQMMRFAEIASRRRENASVLIAGLSGIPGLNLPAEPPDQVHAFHQFTIRLDESARLPRSRLKEILKTNGIEAQIYYPKLVFDYEYLRDRLTVDPKSTPRAAAFSRQVLSLPVHPGLTRRDLDMIITTTRAALGESI